MPTGQPLTRAQYAATYIGAAAADLRYLARRAEAMRRRFKPVPREDLAKMADLRDQIARYRRGDFVTPGDPETTETAPQTA